jgi:hypothetical protein
MPQQQPSNGGWTPVDDKPPAGWEAVGASPGEEGYEAAQQPYGPTPPNTVIGGMLRRGRDVVKGAYQTVTAPPTGADETAASAVAPGALPVYRVGKGIVQGEKQAAGQVGQQLKAAAATKGDPVQKGLAYARAGVTAASMADPFATGAVTNVNQLSDEGRYKEALGQGAFDALSLIAGGRSGREVSPETRLNKLAYATGADSIRPLDHIMPDVEATVTRVGKPQTVGELQTVIDKTMKGYEQQFNKGLYTTKGQFVPDQIADALEDKARNQPPTAEGRVIAKRLNKAATEYRKPWTAQDLNKERMYRNANTQAFHNKSQTGQMAAMRANSDTMVDEIVARESRDVLYNEMERQHPGQGYRDLKQKQSSVLDMQGKFADHVEKLEAAQAKRSGAPLSEKAGVSTSVHAGGVTPRAHVTELLKRGPLTHANTATKAAFGPTSAALARRTAILSLPVSSITMQRPATVPPPPTGQDDEGPQ